MMMREIWLIPWIILSLSESSRFTLDCLQKEKLCFSGSAALVSIFCKKNINQMLMIHTNLMQTEFMQDLIFIGHVDF